MLREKIIICLLIIVVGALCFGNFAWHEKYKGAIDQLNQADRAWQSKLAQVEMRFAGELSYNECLEYQIKQLEQELQKVWGGNKLRDFPDMATLQHFLADDKTDLISGTMPYIPETYVCSHYAFELMRNAAEKGYRIYPVLEIASMGNVIYGLHMSNFAVVTQSVAGYGEKNLIVLIEPQTDEIWLFGSLYDDPATWRKTWYPFLP